jgi:hypothetical protein
MHAQAYFAGATQQVIYPASGGGYVAGPNDVAIDANGTIYIAGGLKNGRVAVISAEAEGLLQAGVDNESGAPTLAQYQAAGINAFHYDITCNGALVSPVALEVDGAGDLFIADPGVPAVFESNVFGTNPNNCSQVSTGAINLVKPDGVAIDQYGSLYIADTAGAHDGTHPTASDNHGFIAMIPYYLGGGVNPATFSGGPGTCTSTAPCRPFILANSGTAADNGPAGVSNPERISWSIFYNELLVADTSNNRVLTMPAYGSDGSPSGAWNSKTPITEHDWSATFNLTLSSPFSFVTDSAGNYYILDQGNLRVLQAPANDNRHGYIMTLTSGINSPPWTGKPLPGLRLPVGMQVDQHGNVWVADAAGNTTAASGTVFYGLGTGNTGGTPSSAPSSTSVNFLSVPVNDPLGSGDKIQTLTFSIPSGETVSSAVATTQGAPNLDFTILAGSTTCNNGFGNGQCSVAVKFAPTVPGLRRGAVTIYDTFGDPIAQANLFGVSTAPQAEFLPAGYAATVSTGSTAVEQPVQIALDGENNLYVADYIGGDVVNIAAGGGAASVLTGFPAGQFAGVAIDGAGNIFIADQVNSAIKVKTPNSDTIYLLNPADLPAGPNSADTGSVYLPQALAFDASGNLFVAEYGNNRVDEISDIHFANGAFNGYGSVVNTASHNLDSNAGGGDYRSVTGVAVDSNENIYIADSYNNTVLAAPQTVSTLVPGYNSTSGVYNWPGLLAFSTPQGLAVDGFNNLYVAQADGQIFIDQIASGAISMLSTNVANAASLVAGTNLQGVTVDSSGNIYVPDYADNRIVEYSPNVAPNFNFGSVAVGSKSATQQFLTTNMGDEALTFTSSAITSNFDVDATVTDPCGTVWTTSAPLEPGSGCNFGLFFQPAMAGMLTGTLTTTDNSLFAGAIQTTGAFLGSAAQVDNLSGTGLLNAKAAIALTSGANSVFLENPVTLTATVTGVAGVETPTGTVTFIDSYGNTSVAPVTLGTAALNSSGVATLTIPFLENTGTHNITAIYNGDTSYAAVDSSAMVETVEDFAFATPIPASAAVNPGSSATFTITISPVGGTTFPAAITLTVTGGPAGSTATLSPTSVASGAAATTATLTVKVPSAIPASTTSSLGMKLSPFLLALLLPILGLRRMRRVWTRYLAVLILVLSGLAAAAGLNGCTSTPSGYFGQGGTIYSYDLTITGTAGGLTHSVVIPVQVN